MNSDFTPPVARYAVNYLFALQRCLILVLDCYRLSFYQQHVFH